MHQRTKLPKLEELMKTPRVIRTLRAFRLRGDFHSRRPDKIHMGWDAWEEYCLYVNRESDCSPIGGAWFAGIPVVCDEELDPHEIRWGTPPGAKPKAEPSRATYTQDIQRLERINRAHVISPQLLVCLHCGLTALEIAARGMELYCLGDFPRGHMPLP